MLALLAACRRTGTLTALNIAPNAFFSVAFAFAIAAFTRSNLRDDAGAPHVSQTSPHHTYTTLRSN
jgi:hypothetical protein